jgi:hypothetical protein
VIDDLGYDEKVLELMYFEALYVQRKCSTRSIGKAPNVITTVPLCTVIASDAQQRL